MKDERQPTHSAQDVRQGEIILRSRARMIVFFGGLAGIVVLVLGLGLYALAGG